VGPVIEIHGLTDPGRKRRNNEDAMALDPALGLAMVADGMGGHQSGEVASSLAVQTLAQFVGRAAQDRDLTWPFGFEPERSYVANCLMNGFKLANRRVFGEACGDESLSGMGTTLVAALVEDRRLAVAGVGDSRAYLARRGALRQLTRDDSWVEAALSQHLIAAGERHRHPLRHVLTKAIGLADEVEFDVHEEVLEAGDRVLLCSDGLTSVLSDDRIQTILDQHPADLGLVCRALVTAANAGGGPDNVTVVMLRCVGAPDPGAPGR
jgi:protein phosphatase